MNVQSWLVNLCELLCTGLYEFLLDSFDPGIGASAFEIDTAYLCASVACSLFLTLAALLFGAMLQGMFNLFGAVFKSAGVKGVAVRSRR